MKRPDEMKMMTNTKKKQTRNVVMTIFGISVSSYFTFVLVFRILPILSSVDQTLHENLLMLLQNNNASTPHLNQTALSTIPIAANANDKTSSLISTVLVDDDLASSILKGEKTLPVLSSTEQQDDDNDDNKKTPKQRTVVKFTPGSLGMKSSETLQFCYTDPTIYQHHFRPTGFGHSISHQYQMIYPFVPKSGSSTARAMMTTRFNAGENWSKEMYDNFGNMSSTNYTVFTFVRDPLSRFFSSYDEAISRQVPWGGGGKKNNNIRIRYPYLYEGMASWADYTNTYCPKHLRLNNEINYCDKNPTMENGTLAQRLTKYVHETGNMNPFDLHLHLQVPLLSNSLNGMPYHIDEIHGGNTHQAWNDIAVSKGLNLSIPDEYGRVGVYHGRSRLRRVDVNRFITDETKQHICQIALLDYCCLNLPLPPPCTDLYCKMDYSDKLSTDSDKDGNEKRRLQIRPWSLPWTQEVVVNMNK